MPELETAIGLMSGTSMDGIDLALVRTDGESRVERGPAMGVAYDPAFRRHLAEHGVRPGAGIEVLRDAVALVRERESASLAA